MAGQKHSYRYEWLRRSVDRLPIFWGGAEALTESHKRHLLSPRLRRQFAYAVARYKRERGLPRARAAVVAASIDAGLQNWHLSAGGQNRA